MLTRLKDIFKGAVLHSVDYKSSHQWKGKIGIIVGTGNTGNSNSLLAFPVELN
jgi:cation diffusion facilitator CzcD-associated flavoprotein CzcO